MNVELLRFNGKTPGVLTFTQHHLMYTSKVKSEEMVIAFMNIDQVIKKAPSSLSSSSSSSSLASSTITTTTSSSAAAAAVAAAAASSSASSTVSSTSTPTSASSSLSSSTASLSTSASAVASLSSSASSSTPFTASASPTPSGLSSDQQQLLLILRCHDFRNVVFRFFSEADITSASLILKSSYPDAADKLYPFFYIPPSFPEFNGWSLYDVRREYERMSLRSKLWRCSDVNAAYRCCESYPRQLFVPSDFDEKYFADAFKSRLDYAAPVLSYFHTATHAALVRAGLPMPSPSSLSAMADNKLMEAIHRANPQKKACVVDTRSPSAATAQRKKYPNAHGDSFPGYQRYFLGLEGYQTLRDSLAKLLEIEHDLNLSASSFVSKLDSSGWLKHVRLMLVAATSIAKLMQIDGFSVVVTSQEPFDIGTICISLTMILLDPYFRTVEGFQVLIEKEWLSFGHRFSDRHCHYGAGGTRFKGSGPVFTLFLDCVWQLLQQYPASFQFGEHYLLFIRDHSYSSPFGTFLMNNEAERTAARLSESTQSLWSFLSEPENLHPLTNPLYVEPLHAVLKPSCRPQNVQPWIGLYARYFYSWEARAKVQQALLALREEGAVLSLALDAANEMAAEAQSQIATLELKHSALLSELRTLHPTAESDWSAHMQSQGQDGKPQHPLSH